MIIIACRKKCEIGKTIEGAYYTNGEWVLAVAKVVKESSFEAWKQYRKDNSLESIETHHPNESFYYEIHAD